MKNKIILVGIILLCYQVCLFAASPFPMYLNEKDGIRLLKGVNRIPVLFYKDDSKVDKELSDKISEDLKLKLRMIGQEPVDWKWWDPYLLVSLNFKKIPDEGTYFGGIEVEFYKMSYFAQTDIPGYSVVWSGGGTFAHADEEHVRQFIKDCIDDFLNLYLQANPRKYVGEASGNK